jgi:uncharacterized protein
LVSRLNAQIDAAIAGADVAFEAISGQMDSLDAREKIGTIEHTGDAARGELIELLYSAFMTPIDREDLFRLSRSIDDILDNLRDFVREVDLLGVQDPLHFCDIIETVSEALERLREAVVHVLVDMASVPDTALAAKKSGNSIRQLYQVAIADVLNGEFTSDTLKKRELLRRLDVVGLRIGEAADALADGAMKRSH